MTSGRETSEYMYESAGRLRCLLRKDEEDRKTAEVFRRQSITRPRFSETSGENAQIRSNVSPTERNEGTQLASLLG